MQEAMEEAETLLLSLQNSWAALQAERNGWMDLFTGNTKRLLERNEELEKGLRAAVAALTMMMSPPPQPLKDTWFARRDVYIQHAKDALNGG